MPGSATPSGPILLEERRNLPDMRQYQRETPASARQQIVRPLENTDEEQRAAPAPSEDHSRTWRPISTRAGRRRNGRRSARSCAPCDRPQQLLEKLGAGYPPHHELWGDDSQRKLKHQAEQYGSCSIVLVWLRSSSRLCEWLQGWTALTG